MSFKGFTAGEKLAHAYILASPSMEELRGAAREICAAALCSSGGKRPCGVCRDCRKVREGIHPDVITVQRLVGDNGKLKQQIGVDQIREVVRDSVVLPNEASGKVYVIEEAELMGIPAQNAALKLLEEPPAGVVLILLARSAESLLPTVRSRCAEISLVPETEETEDETAALALEFIKCVASGDRIKLFCWCAANESMDTLSALAFVERAAAALTDMLCGRRSGLGMSPERIYALERLLERCRDMLRVNTSVKHVLGLLAVRAIE